VLSVNGISKTYFSGTQNEVNSLVDVSLEVSLGDFVVIIGSNGSGKSTMLNVVAGTVKPEHGRIFLRGEEITHWPEHRRARYIGRVFQDPSSGTAASLTVEENMALASHRGSRLGLRRALTAKDRDEFKSRLQLLGLGLEDKLNIPIGRLSGGQRQVLTLMMATWNQPALLLLDEHTAALDPKSAELVMRLSQEIISRLSLTTIMVTHSMQQAVGAGNRLLMMHRGEVRLDLDATTKKRLRTHELLQLFDEIRRDDLLDESAAELLRTHYV